MKIRDLLETVSVGSVGASSIATVTNPHHTNPYRKGSKKPKQAKPRKILPTDNALDMDVSLFGGAKIKR